jgi:hypothetical protein
MIAGTGAFSESSAESSTATKGMPDTIDIDCVGLGRYPQSKPEAPDQGN